MTAAGDPTPMTGVTAPEWLRFVADASRAHTWRSTRSVSAWAGRDSSAPTRTSSRELTSAGTRASRHEPASASAMPSTIAWADKPGADKPGADKPGADQPWADQPWADKLAS